MWVNSIVGGFSNPSNRAYHVGRFRRSAPPAIVLVVGLALSLSAFFVLKRPERSRMQDDFTYLFDNYLASLQDPRAPIILQKNLEIVAYIQDRLSAGEELEPELLPRAIDAVIPRNTETWNRSALLWIHPSAKGPTEDGERPDLENGYEHGFVIAGNVEVRREIRTG